MTDSDCMVPKNWIREMIDPIIKRRAVAVQGMIKPIIKNYWTMQIQKEKEKNMRERMKDGKIGLLDTANFAIKRSVLEEVGYTNPEVFSGNDTELMLRLTFENYLIAFKNVAVLHHHPDTAVKIFKKFFKRGEWDKRIREDNKDKRQLFSRHTRVDDIQYMGGLVLRLFMGKGDFRYSFVSGTAWRLGALYAKLHVLFRN